MPQKPKEYQPPHAVTYSTQLVAAKKIVRAHIDEAPSSILPMAMRAVLSHLAVVENDATRMRGVLAVLLEAQHAKHADDADVKCCTNPICARIRAAMAESRPVYITES